VSKYIQPCTLEAAYEVASNLREDDRKEVVEGHGHNPIIDLPIASQAGFCVSFTVPNGKTAGVAGIVGENNIWMLTTPAIHDYPITFAREAKRFIDSRPEPYLWNIVDKRNTVHLKLLQFLGFKFLREITYGPNNLTFIEFIRVSTRSTRHRCSH
jgi:hypothetical protein